MTAKTTIDQELPFDVFEQEVIDPLRGIELSDMERFVGSVLLEATSEKPIKVAEIICRALHEKTITLDDRKIRTIVRSLRRDHAFPICSRKGKPAGYYWGRSEAELEEFAGVWMAQYKDEAATLHRMLKENYPRLAGQMRLALEE